jgi:hypothetical protein
MSQRLAHLPFEVRYDLLKAWLGATAPAPTVYAKSVANLDCRGVDLLEHRLHKAILRDVCRSETLSDNECPIVQPSCHSTPNRCAPAKLST